MYVLFSTQYSNLASYRAVYDQISRTNGEIPGADVFQYHNFEKVLGGKMVILQEWLTFRDQVAVNCPNLSGHGFLYFSEESLANLFISWYTRPDFDAVISKEFNTRSVRIALGCLSNVTNP